MSGHHQDSLVCVESLNALDSLLYILQMFGEGRVQAEVRHRWQAKRMEMKMGVVPISDGSSQDP